MMTNLAVGYIEMDGCQSLRRLRRESKVGTIELSRRGDESIVLAALEAGTDDHLA